MNLNKGFSSPTGAEWSKWDLHVHTPSSIIQHYESKNNDVWETYINDLENLPEIVKVIGINDYQFLDGYKKVLEYKNAGRLKNIDLLLPILEFRIKKFGGHKEFKRINLHIIFSNELTPEIIQDQFLNTLTAEYNLSPEIQTDDLIRWSGAITRASLEDLGRKIKATVPEDKIINFGSDLEEGFNNLNIDDTIIIEKLRKSSYFEGKFLIAIGKTEWDAFNWNDNSIAEKKHVINSAHFVFTASETPASFYNAKQKLIEQKVNNLLLDCSDSHYNSWSINKDRLGNCFTWIKADRTFEGLRQIIKDKDRVYVGDIPPHLERVQQNPTKYISNLDFKKVTGVINSEIWFEDLSLPLNSSLVAIIGNKGQGKSAIADTIGLVGNSKSYLDFSFITKDKFKRKRPVNLSEIFEATLTWESGYKFTKKLSEIYDPTIPESIKYIPQGFLEKLCNDDIGLFEDELKKVIYSHIPQENKQGYNSLDEIIDAKSDVLKDEIKIKESQLDILIDSIVRLEARLTPEERKRIQELILQRELELKIHEEQKPAKVDPPDDPIIIQKNKVISDSITEKRGNIQSLEIEIKRIKSEITDITGKTDILKVIIGKLSILKNRIDEVEESVKSDLTSFGLSWTDLIEFKYNPEKLNAINSDCLSKLRELQLLVSDSNADAPVLKFHNLNYEIAQLQLQLDSPSRIYQKYLNDIDSWNRKRNSIIGDDLTVDTLSYLKSELNYLDNQLESDLNEIRLKRIICVKDLFQLKLGIIELYKQAFSPLTTFIDEYNETLKTYSISLDVTFRIDALIEKFFDHINLGAKGSFSGSISGPEKLKGLIESFDFSNVTGIMELLNVIQENLFKDKREGQNDEDRFVENQLKKGYTVKDLYSLMYNLEYLIPEYKLKLGGKNIVELSPGERGALLLIFYLTLDKEDIPLIIDQPEENLDNQSVYNILVQFISIAKNKRQIIIVTHNPNLAVVCDAEQIVHVKMDKLNGNKLTITSGAIENQTIRTAVVDILEGTYPAFDKRKWKYDVIK